MEKFFKCPFCRETISMVLDDSTEDLQVYVEDCEVCCNPIQLSYQITAKTSGKGRPNVSDDEQSVGGKITGFRAEKAYE